MARVLAIIALGVVCVFSGSASADHLKPQDRTASSDISSRQRCVCSSWRPRAAGVVRSRHYYGVRSAYLIGYDVLPYRFGSTFVWEPPYRYYR